MRLYGEISKVEPKDDGTIMVYGYASSEVQDTQGEVVTADAMKAALPEYMVFANVREMHQPSAVGTAKEASVQDDGRTWFGAHVVDPVAVKKVQTGVYKGFSIGGKVKDRDQKNASIITALRLNEVSLVDRPANPEAVFTCWKMDEDADEKAQAVEALAKLLNEGKADPVALLKLAQGEPSKPEEKPEPPADEAKKGMYELREFASCISSIAYLVAAAQQEADWEKDSSPLPGKLRDWLTAGVGIYKEMTEEETSELMAGLAASVKATAERTGDVAKAGARFSKATKSALGGIHKMIRECDKALADMGYEAADDDDASMSEKPGDVKKDTGTAPEPAADDALKAEVGNMGELLKSLTEKVKALEGQPAPAKGALKVVEKAAEVTLNNGADRTILAESDFVKGSDGKPDVTATAIKLVHRMGGQRIG